MTLASLWEAIPKGGKMKRSFISAVLAALTLTAGTAQASLIGISVSGELKVGHHLDVITSQFSSPQTVSDAIEFSGTLLDTSDQIWTATVDLDSTTITIEFDSPYDFANISTFPGYIVNITLTGLPATLTGLELKSFECQDNDWVCYTQFDNGLLHSSLTDGVFSASFKTLVDSNRYVFGVTSKVPEPATMALIGLGLFGVSLGRRRPLV